MKKYLLLVILALYGLNLYAGVKQRSGSFYTSFYDFKFTRPIPFSFIRSYSSNINSSGWFGRGWISPLETSLKKSGKKLVIKHYGQGIKEFFSLSRKDVFKSKLGNEIQITDKGYTFTQKRNKYYFNKNFQLISSTTKDHTLFLKYTNSEKYPSSISNLALESVSLYWENGRVIKAKLNNNKEINYKYDDKYNLLEVSRNNQKWNYTYNQANNLNTITYPTGKMKTIEYKKFKVSSVTMPNGDKISYKYKVGDKSLTVEIDKRPKIGKARTLTHVYEYKTSRKENVIKYISPKNVEYNIDPKTQRVQQTSAQGVKESFFYNEKGWLKKVKDQTGEFNLTYNKKGKLTQVANGNIYIKYKYSKKGQIKSILSNEIDAQLTYDKRSQYKTIITNNKILKKKTILHFETKKNGTLKAISIVGLGRIKVKYDKNGRPIKLKRNKKEIAVHLKISSLLRDIVRITEPFGLKFEIISE